MQLSDEKLVALCRDNKRQGFDLLYSKYQLYIYRLCYNYTHSKEDALDLLQEVYIKIYKSIASFEKGRPLSPWIKRITINTCHNFARGKKISTTSLEMAPLLVSEENVEGQISYKTTRELLQISISQLPSEMKSVVVLRHMDNMTYKEISETLSIPVGTVKTYLFRGRKILKDKLKKQGVWGCDS